MRGPHYLLAPAASGAKELRRISRVRATRPRKLAAHVKPDVMRDSRAPPSLRASINVTVARNPRMGIRSHRTQALYPLRAKPFSRRYAVPGRCAPFAPTRFFNSPRPKSWPLPARKTRRLTQNNRRSTNALTNPPRPKPKGSPTAQTKMAKGLTRFPFFAKREFVTGSKGTVARDIHSAEGKCSLARMNSNPDRDSHLLISG